MLRRAGIAVLSHIVPNLWPIDFRNRHSPGLKKSVTTRDDLRNKREPLLLTWKLQTLNSDFSSGFRSTQKHE